VRKPFSFCWKRHTHWLTKFEFEKLFSLFNIISTQASYIHKKLDTNNCFAKLRAISNLFSFFYTPCITLNSTLLKLIVFKVNVFSLQRTLNILRKFAVAKPVNVNMWSKYQYVRDMKYNKNIILSKPLSKHNCHIMMQ
jgi:hypothetical protein